MGWKIWENVGKAGEEAGFFAKLFGKSEATIAKEAAAAAAKAGEDAAKAKRVEPTMGSAAPKPKLTPEETKAFLKAQEDAKAAKIAAEKAKPLEFEAQNTEGLGIKKGADPRSGTGAAAKTAEAATAAKAVEQTEKLSYFKAWFLESRFSMKNNTLTDRLRMLNNGGHPDMAESLLARERVKGFRAEDVTDIRQAVKIGDLPASMGAAVEKANNARIMSTRTPKEWAAAHLNYIAKAPVMGTLTAAKDLVALPFQAAGAIGKGLKYTGAILTGALVVDAGAHLASATVSNKEHPLLETSKNTVKDIGGVAGWTIGAAGTVVSWLPGAWAAKKAEQLANLAISAVPMALNGADQLSTGALQGAVESYDEQVNGQKAKTKEGDKMGILGFGADAAKVARELKEREEKRKGTTTPGADAAGDTPTETEAAAKPAAVAGVAVDGEPNEGESEADYVKRSTSKMSLADKATWAKDRAKHLKDSVFNEGEMKKVSDLAQKGGWMGMLGAIFGFMSGGSKTDKLMNAMGLGLLFSMLGKALGISTTADLGHNTARPGANVSQYNKGYFPMVSEANGMANNNRHEPMGRTNYRPASASPTDPSYNGYGPQPSTQPSATGNGYGPATPSAVKFGPGSGTPVSQVRSDAPAPFVQTYGNDAPANAATLADAAIAKASASSKAEVAQVSIKDGVYVGEYGNKPTPAPVIVAQGPKVRELEFTPSNS